MQNGTWRPRSSSRWGITGGWAPNRESIPAPVRTHARPQNCGLPLHPLPQIPVTRRTSHALVCIYLCSCNCNCNCKLQTASIYRLMHLHTDSPALSTLSVCMHPTSPGGGGKEKRKKEKKNPQ